MPRAEPNHRDLFKENQQKSRKGRRRWGGKPEQDRGRNLPHSILMTRETGCQRLSKTKKQEKGNMGKQEGDGCIEGNYFRRGGGGGGFVGGKVAR